MIEEMKLRNFSPATQASYIYAVSRLAKYHNKSPDQLSKEDIPHVQYNHGKTLRCFEVHGPAEKFD
jgi:hypothetical protein